MYNDDLNNEIDPAKQYIKFIILRWDPYYTKTILTSIRLIMIAIMELSVSGKIETDSTRI